MFHIEYWYDRFLKTWTVLLKDEEGNQVADAIYTYSKKSAEETQVSEFNLYDQYK